MPENELNRPYWQSRAIAEQVLEGQGLIRGKEIDRPKGQHWHIKGGITFAIQWLGDHLDYVDSEVIAHVLTGVADWRAKNPPKFS